MSERFNINLDAEEELVDSVFYSMSESEISDIRSEIQDNDELLQRLSEISVEEIEKELQLQDPLIKLMVSVEDDDLDLEGLREEIIGGLSSIDRGEHELRENVDFVIEELMSGSQADIDEVVKTLHEISEQEVPPTIQAQLQENILEYMDDHDSNLSVFNQLDETLRETVMPTLLHGTSTKYLESIKSWGLEAHVGEWVTQVWSEDYVASLREQEWSDIVNNPSISDEEKQEKFQELWDDIIEENPEQYKFVYAAPLSRAGIVTRASEFHNFGDEEEVPAILRVPSSEFNIVNQQFDDTIAEPHDFISTYDISPSDIEIATPIDTIALIQEIIEPEEVQFQPLRDVDVLDHKRDVKKLLNLSREDVRKQISDRNRKIRLRKKLQAMLLQITVSTINKTKLDIEYDGIGKAEHSVPVQRIIEDASDQVIRWYVERIGNIVKEVVVRNA